jgi:hybrid cluster-associated redox disulfide protein
MTKHSVQTNNPAPQVTKEANLAELVFKYPATAEVLLDYGLHCVGCGGMQYDTVEAGAKLHGYSASEIDELVLRLNEVIDFKE